MKKKMKCSVCGKEFEKQGSLNLHEYHCKLKNGQGVQQQQNKQVVNQNSCDHDYRALNSRDSLEYRAINAGFTEVCDKCENLQ